MSGIWTLTRGTSGYPDCLLRLGERAPAALYGLGDRDLVSAIQPAEAVTIVGARRSGAYGCGVARELGHGAGAAGLVVVSGMAYGCDSAAHEGALAGGGLTVAVLGCGPDVVYPPSKADLHGRIIAGGGAVIAEQLPGTQPKPGHFPLRNRIMVALADLAVIVEGEHRSGTRHTQREAEEQNTDVAAVPGPVNSALSELPNDLLHDGAAVVRHAQDLLDLALGVGRVAMRGLGPPLEEHLRAVLAAVEAGATTCDAVANEAAAAGSDAAIALARLELMGYLVSDEVGRFARTMLAPPS